MPYLYIRAINQTFVSRDGGEEYGSLEEARRAAVIAAAEIALEEVKRGSSQAIIEACVEDEAGRPLSKVVVSLCAGNLQLKTGV